MFEEVLKDHNVVLIVKFGSHLYGTNTPTSDADFKGIFVPKLNDVMLNRVPKCLNFDTNKSDIKNSADDVDFEMYSLHYFFELARKGETVAIDMLHANEASIVYKSPLWDTIAAQRAMFYTSNMKSLVGYARKQAAKYGMKGSRLASAKRLREQLTAYTPEVFEDEQFRVKYVYKDITEDDNIKKGENETGMRVINFCGKQIQETVKVSYAVDMIDKFIKQYGHRAKLAETNDGVDFKALSHALRAAYQLREIFETGDLKFPLSMADQLKAVKNGEVDFKLVLHNLEDSIDTVEKLADTVNLPAKVDNDKVDRFLLELLAKEYYD